MATKALARYFAEVVRHHRKEMALSQERLAEKANLSSKMISLVERGERIPSLTVAENIAKGLSVPLWRLIKDAENLKRQ
jgi:transcriptional regulator with XRE-family HTH domain